MDRRGFLGKLIGGVAATAAARTWPFRVYSFPAEPTLFDVPLPDVFFQDTPWTHSFRIAGNFYVNNPRAHCRVTGITMPSDTEIEAYG
jgi:hypothetical protein